MQISNYKISYSDVMYSTENIVNNVIIMLMTDGYWTYCGDHIVKAYKC